MSHTCSICNCFNHAKMLYCPTECEQKYSLHNFPPDNMIIHAKSEMDTSCTRAEKNWEGLMSDSLLCAKHYTPECVETDGSCYQDAVMQLRST